MNARKCVHTRQPLRGAWLCCRTAHAVQTRQAHHDNVAMASCTLVRAAVGMSCDQKASTVCSLPARGQQQQPYSSHMAGATGRADDCKRPTGPEADAGFRRFVWLPLGETVFQDFQRRKSAVGDVKMRVLGLQNAIFLRGAEPRTPLGLAPQTPPL